MKKIVYLILILPYLVFSQNSISEVIYKKRSTLSLDSITKGSLKKNKTFQDFTILLADEMDKINYSLLFTNKESYFEIIETLETPEAIDFRAEFLAKSIGGGNEKVYVDRENEQQLIQKDFMGESFIIKSKLKRNEYKITDEFKEINGFVCFKATKNKILYRLDGEKLMPVVAWFTPQIPYPYGPATFNGLPGLIMELNYLNVTFYVTKITLNKRTDKTISIPKKGKLISDTTFQKIREKGINDVQNKYK